MAADDFKISHVDIGDFTADSTERKKDRLLVSWSGEFGDGKFEIGRDEEDDSFNIYFDTNETDPKLLKAVLVELVNQSVVRKNNE